MSRAYDEEFSWASRLAGAPANARVTVPPRFGVEFCAMAMRAGSASARPAATAPEALASSSWRRVQYDIGKPPVSIVQLILDYIISMTWLVYRIQLYDTSGFWPSPALRPRPS